MPVWFVDLLRLLCNFPLNFDILPFYILGVNQDSESEQCFFCLFVLNQLNFLTTQHAQPDTAFLMNRMTTYSASVTLLKHADLFWWNHCSERLRYLVQTKAQDIITKDARYNTQDVANPTEKTAKLQIDIPINCQWQMQIIPPASEKLTHFK